MSKPEPTTIFAATADGSAVDEPRPAMPNRKDTSSCSSSTPCEPSR